MAFMARQDTDGRILPAFRIGACTSTPQRMAFVEETVRQGPHCADALGSQRSVGRKGIGSHGKKAFAVYKEPAVRGLLVRMLYPMLQAGA